MEHGLPGVLSQTLRTMVHSRMRTAFRGYSRSHPHADLLLIDGQTIQDEGVDAMELLQRVARSVRCVVLDSTSPGYTNDDVGDAALVDKPVDSTAIVELLDRHLHRPALPA